MDALLDGRSVKELKSFSFFLKKKKLSSYKFGSVSLLSTCYWSASAFWFLGLP